MRYVTWKLELVSTILWVIVELVKNISWVILGLINLYSTDKLPRIKERAYVINLDDKESNATH